MVYYHEMIPFLVGLATIILLAIYSFRRSHMHMATTFGWLMVAVGWWVGTYLLDLANTDFQTKLFFLKLKYVGATTSSVLWLILAIVFTQNERWLSKTFYTVAGLWSTSVVLLVFTNDWHYLFWSAYNTDPEIMEPLAVRGPLFLLYAIGGAGVVPLSIVIYGSHLVKVEKFYRNRAIMFILGGCLPIFGYVAHVFGYPLVPNVDQVPLMLGFGCCIYAIAIFRYQALDVLKVAQNLVIDSVNAGVIVVDHKRMILGFNPYAADILSGARINQNIEAVMPEVKQLELRGSQEFEIEVSTNATRYFLVKVSEIENASVGNLGHALILFDITERKLAEQALTQSLETRSRFFANMSHELRTPLHGITGLLELIKSTPEKDKQLSYIQQAEASAELLQSLIDDVLDLSKIEANRLNFESVPFDPIAVMENVNSILALQASEKGLFFSVNTEDSLLSNSSLSLKGDPLRLTQVLSNLGSNAIKFTDEGEVEICVRSMASQKDRLTLRFSVRDTGPGIPKEQQSAMFEPFTQRDTSITRQFGGSGLGLAIAKQLVNGMGGDLHLDSEPGRGSTFQFDLELSISTEQTTAKTASDFSHLAGRSVLVVDDSSVNRQIAEDMLLKVDVNVELADSGEEATKLISRRSYDGVLMDIHMPGMDGFSTTRDIRKKNPTLPIIAMTASAFQEDQEEAKAAGMSGFIAKPFQARDLYQIISQCLPNTPTIRPVIEANESPMDSAKRQKLLIDLHRDISDRLEALGDERAEWVEFVHFAKGSAGFLGATELLGVAKQLDFDSTLDFRTARRRFEKALESLAPNKDKP